MLSSLFCSRGSTSTTAVSAATATMSPQKVAAASPEGIGTSVGGWSLLRTFSWLPVPRVMASSWASLVPKQVAGPAGQPALEADRVAAHQLGNRVAVVDGIESPVRPDGGITNSVDHLLPHPAGLQVEGDDLGFGSQQVDQSLVQVRTDDPANSWQGPSDFHLAGSNSGGRYSGA